MLLIIKTEKQSLALRTKYEGRLWCRLKSCYCLSPRWLKELPNSTNSVSFSFLSGTLSWFLLRIVLILDAQITLLYIPPHSCPRLSLLYPFHPCFCRFWAAQIPIYRICSTKKFLSVQEILQYDSLADCLKAICHPSQRAERLRSVEETRPRSGSRAASIARSRSAQVNWNFM